MTFMIAKCALVLIPLIRVDIQLNTYYMQGI